MYKLGKLCLQGGGKGPHKEGAVLVYQKKDTVKIKTPIYAAVFLQAQGGDL